MIKRRARALKGARGSYLDILELERGAPSDLGRRALGTVPVERGDLQWEIIGEQGEIPSKESQDGRDR